ncbi:MAG: autotransporter-associated beta strand repeat-containing protein [Kiritimatiellales bacterium]
MKKKVLGIMLLVAGLSLAAQAEDLFRAANNTTLNVSGAFTNALGTATIPGAGDVAVWDKTYNVGPAGQALAADGSWQGIRLGSSLNRGITIATNGVTQTQLTLGLAGIDMSAAAQNLTIVPNVVIGASQTWAVSNARTLTVSGVISGTSGSNLTKSDLGTLVLSGDNSYSGTTTISGGTLQIGAGGLTGTLGTGDVINNGSLVFKRTNTMTVANNISGSGSVSYIPTGTKAGTYTVTGNNTYTGDTVISNGNTVIVGSDSNLGNGTKLYIGQNAELHVTNSFATSKAVTMSGGNPALNVDANQTLTLNGSLGSIATATNGTFPIAKNGTGKLVLNAAGSFADKSAFYISAGGLDLGNAAALNGTTLRIGGGSVVLDNTSGLNMTATGMNGLILNAGFTFTGSNDLDLSAAQAGFVANPGDSRTVTVSANKLTLSGILATGTDVSEYVRTNGGLIKAGSGTLVLTGDSDYTGNTVITNDGGKLVINGINLSSNITAYAGATLGGTGTVQAVTMESGSTLSVGNSPGTMTFNDALTLVSGSTNVMEIWSDVSYDVLMGAGTNALTMAGETVFDFTGWAGGVTNGATFAYADMFANWASTNVTGATYSTRGLGVGQSLDFTTDGFTVIPEPATIGMLGLGALLTIMLRRFRTR